MFLKRILAKAILWPNFVLAGILAVSSVTGTDNDSLRLPSPWMAVEVTETEESKESVEAPDTDEFAEETEVKESGEEPIQHEHYYLAGMRLNFTTEILEDVGTIGTDWTFRCFCGEQELFDGSYVEIRSDQYFEWRSVITEDDDVDDVGEVTTQELIRYEEAEEEDTKIITHEVRVDEEGGITNDGSYRVYLVTYTLTKEELTTFKNHDYVPTVEVPEEPEEEEKNDGLFSFLSPLSSEENNQIIAGKTSADGTAGPASQPKKLGPVGIGALGTAGLAIVSGITASMVRNKRKKAMMKVMNIGTDQMEFAVRAKKSCVNGRSLRDIAGVPASVSFLSGFPVGKGKGMFGSYTVYFSSKSQVYHKKKGCSGAKTPAHCFEIQKNFTPCPKCDTTFTPVPGWYTKYKELEQRAMKK